MTTGMGVFAEGVQAKVFDVEEALALSNNLGCGLASANRYK